jgi:hypothetical protein
MELASLTGPLLHTELPTISKWPRPWYCCGRAVFLLNNQARCATALSFSYGGHPESLEMTYGDLHLKPILKGSRWELMYRNKKRPAEEYHPVSYSRPFVVICSNLKDAQEGMQAFNNVSAVLQIKGMYVAHIICVAPPYHGATSPTKPRPATVLWEKLLEIERRDKRQNRSFADLAAEQC